MNFKRDLSNHFMRVGFAMVIAFVVSQFHFDYIESLLFDARVRLKPVSPTSGHIELIAIDPRTVELLGRVPNASDHADLISKLKNSGARAVIYLISPNEIVGSQDELKALAHAMESVPNFRVAVQDVALRGEEDIFKLSPPFEKILSASAPKTSDRNIFAGDDVTRRMFVSYQEQPTLHTQIARMYNPALVSESNIHGSFDYLQSNQVYIDFRPAHTYPTSSFFSVANDEIDLKSRFQNKVIFVGRDIQSTSKDYVKTPFSRDIVAMTLLELHANMLDTLILNSAPERSPEWLDLIVTSLISILTVYVVLTLKPTQGLGLLAATIFGCFIIGFFIFWLGHFWIGMAQPLIAIFISYYFFIPYRLIIENRKSWEYLQKNVLLTQVEELKTNFLSMMSHDLKTPIARIQGMTHVVRNDSNPLSPKQAEAVLNLENSAQELLDFVSSILNLGRIESKEIRLHYKSRDPNSLLNEVVSKLEHLAIAKNIEIMTEFEPLFSVKMDVDLIRQVFTNLVENAIKYSPENTRILVSTEEKDSSVIIQVADQGVGIPEDELGQLFTKFYRAKSAKASATKGSGLGLYLAKYFVELHNGTVSVDSRPGSGSTFTVVLPNEPVGG